MFHRAIFVACLTGALAIATPVLACHFGHSRGGHGASHATPYSHSSYGVTGPRVHPSEGPHPSFRAGGNFRQGTHTFHFAGPGLRRGPTGPRPGASPQYLPRPGSAPGPFHTPRVPRTGLTPT